MGINYKVATLTGAKLNYILLNIWPIKSLIVPYQITWPVVKFDLLTSSRVVILCKWSIWEQNSAAWLAAWQQWVLLHYVSACPVEATRKLYRNTSFQSTKWEINGWFIWLIDKILISWPKQTAAVRDAAVCVTSPLLMYKLLRSGRGSGCGLNVTSYC